MSNKVKNIPASNRVKLLNYSHKTGESFQQVVQLFAMNRFLYRLSQSQYASSLILKGAMLIYAQSTIISRSTLDIDFLAKFDNSESSINDAVKTIIECPVEDDGLIFLPETIKTSAITKDAGYVGGRVNFQGKLDTIIIPMQIDIGFGDVITPAALQIDTPTLLGYPSGKIYGYTFETSIAEKIHVMMKLDLLNSRMKDFYDIWFLMKTNQIDKEILIQAIICTFESRKTKIDMDSVIFTDKFLSNKAKQIQWTAFCRKKKIKDAPILFSEIAKQIFEYLYPILEKTS